MKTYFITLGKFKISNFDYPSEIKSTVLLQANLRADSEEYMRSLISNYQERG